jgi:hypothetical protein
MTERNATIEERNGAGRTVLITVYHASPKRKHTRAAPQRWHPLPPSGKCSILYLSHSVLRLLLATEYSSHLLIAGLFRYVDLHLSLHQQLELRVENGRVGGFHV